MTNPAHPDLAWHLRRLLETVKGACGSKGRLGWLTTPMALFLGMRPRRERRAAAERVKAEAGTAVSG